MMTSDPLRPREATPATAGPGDDTFPGDFDARQLLADGSPQSPFRAPHWRWLLAAHMVDGHNPPRRAWADHSVRVALRLQRALGGARTRCDEFFVALAEAHRIRSAADPHVRWELEANGARALAVAQDATAELGPFLHVREHPGAAKHGPEKKANATFILARMLRGDPWVPRFPTDRRPPRHATFFDWRSQATRRKSVGSTTSRTTAAVHEGRDRLAAKRFKAVTRDRTGRVDRLGFVSDREAPGR
jgi:hypothetical protein